MNSIRYLKSIENNIPLRIPEKSELISLLFSVFYFFDGKNRGNPLDFMIIITTNSIGNIKRKIWF